MLKRILSILMLIFASQVHAISPDSGWWWNPNASGSGYNIEVQDNVLSISAYTFNISGAPIYYISAGIMTSDTSYSGSLNSISGGQCINCPYKAPISGNAGTISINFATPSKASLIINGGAPIAIERLAYGISTASPYAMFGEWASVEGSSIFPVYYGERIQFSSVYTSTSDGSVNAMGQRSGSNSNIALTRLESDGTWSLILDSSTNYYKYFNFTFSGLNTIEGRVWTYLKSSTLSGSGTPFVAFRSQSASFVKTGKGPGVKAAAATIHQSTNVDFEIFNKQQSLNMEDTKDSVDPKISSSAVKLMQTMLELKPTF
jgi:hypothetical protein